MLRRGRNCGSTRAVSDSLCKYPQSSRALDPKLEILKPHAGPEREHLQGHCLNMMQPLGWPLFSGDRPLSLHPVYSATCLWFPGEEATAQIQIVASPNMPPFSDVLCAAFASASGWLKLVDILLQLKRLTQLNFLAPRDPVGPTPCSTEAVGLPGASAGPGQQ